MLPFYGHMAIEIMAWTLTYSLVMLECSLLILACFLHFKTDILRLLETVVCVTICQKISLRFEVNIVMAVISSNVIVKRDGGF